MLVEVPALDLAEWLPEVQDLEQGGGGSGGGDAAAHADGRARRARARMAEE